MMEKTTHLLFFLIIAIGANAQTVISSNLLFGTDQLHVINTHNGDQYIGQILAIRNDTADFHLRTIEDTLSFPLSNIKFIGVAGESIGSFDSLIDYSTSEVKSRPMPNHQLLYTSSALPYPGKGVYRNTMLFANRVELQPKDFLSLGAGFLVPVAISLKVQGNIPINELVNIGLVVQEHIITFDEQFITHPYAIVTLGTYSKYLNFGFGYWIDKQPVQSFRPEETTTMPSFSLGGSINFGKGWRFYSETMILVDRFEKFVLPSIVFAKHKRKSSLEFGVMAIAESDFVTLIPLLSYTHTF